MLVAGHTELGLAKILVSLQGSAAGVFPSCVCAARWVILGAAPTVPVQIQGSSGFPIFKDCVTKVCFREFIALLCTEWIQQLDNC